MNGITSVSEKDKEPILIVDKEGTIGIALSEKLKNEATVVLVSESPPKNEEIIHISYEKKVPQIPDNIYSHIFVIDDGSKATREALTSFLEKAMNDKAVFLFATKLREINEKLIEDLTGYYQKAKILFYGEIFGALGKINEGILNKFILQARFKNKIYVPENGASTYSYPIFFEDLISGILEAIFGQNDDKLFYLFSKHPPSLLSLARTIQKTNPHVTLDFVKEEYKQNVVIPEGGKYLLAEKYSLDSRIKNLEIKEIDLEFGEKEKNEEKESGIKVSFPLSFKLGFFLILFIILLPFLSTFLFSFLGQKNLSAVESYLNVGDFKKAQKSSYFAENFLVLAKNFSNFVPIESLKNSVEKDGNIAIGASSIFDGLEINDFSEVKKGLTYLQRENVNFPLTSFATATIDVWEDILGFKGERKYLILIQEKSELRPTGGVIESLTMLSLEKGKIKDSSIENAKALDGNLKGHVEPPYPLRRHLKTANWSLNDSNFNVDFLESASASALFLDVLKDQKVDGVLAIDSFLFNDINNELKSDRPSYIKLLKAIEKGINEKDILFAFNERNLQNIFTFNNWSGSLWDQRKENKSLINDFLGINEANLGKNKINSSISRSVSQNTKVEDDGEVKSVLGISYKNEGGALYKNYLRFILPFNAKIDGVKIDGETKDTRDAITDPDLYEAKNFKEPKELEIEKYNQSGKTIYGFLINIDPGSQKEIDITYTLSKKASLDSHFSYDLKIFKQPGISYSYSFTISYPEEFKITDGKSTVNKEILKDETISLNLVKK